MSNTSLVSNIEAILFFKGEPVTTKELSRLCSVSESHVREALSSLKGELSSRGLCLLETGDEVMLGTAPESSSLIERITKEELSRDLSKASLETLSTVLYFAPVTRAMIDYVRGINSTFILRNLMIRGLIERDPHPTDERTYLYRPSMELLSHLGITKIDELPEYETVRAELAAFEARSLNENEKKEQQGEGEEEDASQ